jgi:hypothetical protein
MRSPSIYKISPHPSLPKREIKERRFFLPFSATLFVKEPPRWRSRAKGTVTEPWGAL